MGFTQYQNKFKSNKNKPNNVLNKKGASRKY